MHIAACGQVCQRKEQSPQDYRDEAAPQAGPRSSTPAARIRRPPPPQPPARPGAAWTCARVRSCRLPLPASNTGGLHSGSWRCVLMVLHKMTFDAAENHALPQVSLVAGQLMMIQRMCTCEDWRSSQPEVQRSDCSKASPGALPHTTPSPWCNKTPGDADGTKTRAC